MWRIFAGIRDISSEMSIKSDTSTRMSYGKKSGSCAVLDVADKFFIIKRMQVNHGRRLHPLAREESRKLVVISPSVADRLFDQYSDAIATSTIQER